MRKVFIILRIAALFLTIITVLALLTGCGSGAADTAAEPEKSQPSGERALPGYMPCEIEIPEWLSGDVLWDTQGDVIWLGGSSSRGLAIGSYDTLSGQWRQLDLDAGDARHPYLRSMSVCSDALWALIEEGFSAEQVNSGTIPVGLGYYVLHVDLTDYSTSCIRIGFDGDKSTESSDLSFFAILALDGGRAMLGTGSSLYVINPEANVLSRPALPVYGTLFNYKVDEQLYLLTDTDVFAAFDPQSLSLGAPTAVEGYARLSSNNGHALCEKQRAVCLMDPVTGEARELFKWMDVALSYGSMGGHGIFENSRGEFFYPVTEYQNNGVGCIIKVTEGMIPIKKQLTLACFGSSEISAYQEGDYSCAATLMDAVIRFNNTDPEYKISIRPLSYADEAERDRLLIDLATSDDVDIIDTSFLPDNAMDAGLLTDMLPYIDADLELSREDFIQPLLKAMMKDGGLYEYTDKFTILTMSTHPEFFPGREEWTVEYIESLMAEHPEMDVLWHSFDRALQLTCFSYAATAEFIDWDGMSCSFDSPAFSHWLRLLGELPDGGEYSEDAKLLDISYDLAANAGFSARYAIKGDYAVTGFPETEGSGSYFFKLGSPISDWRQTIGENTRLGIMASGSNKDGSWRFVRTLMTHSDGYGVKYGIPVFKDSFEKAVDSAVTTEIDSRFGIAYFNADDAKRLREQVYGTEKLARYDEQVFSIIRAEANAYFAGQKSVEEAAAQIQSQMSLYLAEQG